MLWFTGTPPTHTTIPCSHPHLHPPSCHSDLPQSFPFLLPLTFLISSRFLMPPLCVPHSLNPTHLHTISSSLPSCESPLLPLAPSPASSVYLAACAPVIQAVSGKKESSLSPGSVTLVGGTNCPPLLAYTAGKLRTCGGGKVHGVCVLMCVRDREGGRCS